MTPSHNFSCRRCSSRNRCCCCIALAAFENAAVDTGTAVVDNSAAHSPLVLGTVDPSVAAGAVVAAPDAAVLAAVAPLVACVASLAVAVSCAVVPASAAAFLKQMYPMSLSGKR